MSGGGVLDRSEQTQARFGCISLPHVNRLQRSRPVPGAIDILTRDPGMSRALQGLRLSGARTLGSLADFRRVTQAG